MLFFIFLPHRKYKKKKKDDFSGADRDANQLICLYMAWCSFFLVMGYMNLYLNMCHVEI